MTLCPLPRSNCRTPETFPTAVQLLAELDASPVRPTSLTYTAFAAAAVDAGAVQEAFDVLARMRRARVSAPVSLFNIILTGCVREERPDLAEQVVAAMDEAGVRPTPATLEILQHAEEVA